MVKFTITENDAGQRLDRFFKKYYCNASLAYIYKLIRKDVKVNGKKCKQNFLLNAGDAVHIYISDDEHKRMILKDKGVQIKLITEVNTAPERYSFLQGPGIWH